MVKAQAQAQVVHQSRSEGPGLLDGFRVGGLILAELFFSTYAS